MDFTEVKSYTGYKYLLVLVYTCSTCLEAFATRTLKKVLEHYQEKLSPDMGCPYPMVTIMGLAFVTEITQKLTKELKIKRNLHTAYRSQSSGKVKRPNKALKSILTK